jgi:small subunit ribosomal protein S13
MPRIAGIDIPNDKRIDIALTYIFGIGDKVAKDILKQARVEPNIRTKDLTSNELKGIQAVIETLPTEGELRKIVRDNIETLKRIQSYRGLRHTMGLPAHGQRTRTNARTKKGKRKTIGAIAKDATVTPEAETKK